MSAAPDPRVTALLAQGPDAVGPLLDLVYDELRTLARKRMRAENAAHTLQATALVHEACLRLLGTEQRFTDRRHFFGAASEAMRRVLIDHARKARADKRGGGAARVTLGAAEAAIELEPEEVLELDHALDQLADQDADAAEVTRLRFFAGLSVQEAAEVLGVSVRTVHRRWIYARARLTELLAEAPPSPHPTDGDRT